MSNYALYVNQFPNLSLNNNNVSVAEIMSAPAPVGGDSSFPDDVIIKITPKADPTITRKETEAGSASSSSSDHNSVRNSIWRETSYDFSQDAAKSEDLDFVHEPSHLSIINESPKNHGKDTIREVRISFHENVTDSILRRSSVSGSLGRNGDSDEKLSKNSSFKRKSSLLLTKTKSRLMDPPGHDHTPSNTALRSGVLEMVSELEEDDPFWGEDLPEEYKKIKFTALNLLELVSLILLVAAFVCSLTIRRLKKVTVFELHLWKWFLMVLVLICGRLVSGWGIRFVVFLIERSFLLRKRVLYFVYGLRKAVQNCIWLALVLIAWQSIFDKRVERATNGELLPYITKVWVCLLVGTFIWLLKTLLVKVLASSFHVSTFFDRIQDSLFNQYVIETMSGPPLIEIQDEQDDEASILAEVQKLHSAGMKLPSDIKESVLKNGKVIGKTPTSATALGGSAFSAIMDKKEEKGFTIGHLHRLNQKNISAWNMKRMMNIVRKGVLSTLDEKLRDSTIGDEGITSENHAKIAARKIFFNVARPGAKFIYLEDLMRFMREDEAIKTFRLFEGASECKGISKKALKNWLVNAFRERRALALSLNDTKTAVNKLHQMLNIIVAVLVLVMSLLILKIATTHFFIFFSSQLLLIVFIFGNTCKTTFEAIIFLFVMHPFDVGDRVDVDGVQMVVEEMNILTTVFLRYDNQKIIYPNSVLITKPISNYFRSPDMGDAIDFCIHISTPMEKIASMKERIIRYVENKSEHWYPGPAIVMRDVEDMNRMKWSVWLSHKMNHQDMGERWARRALLVEEMVKIFRDLDIEYRMLPLDVNIRNMPSLSSSRLPSNWTVSSM